MGGEEIDKEHRQLLPRIFPEVRTVGCLSFGCEGEDEGMGQGRFIVLGLFSPLFKGRRDLNLFKYY